MGEEKDQKDLRDKKDQKDSSDAIQLESVVELITHSPTKISNEEAIEKYSQFVTNVGNLLNVTADQVRELLSPDGIQAMLDRESGITTSLEKKIDLYFENVILNSDRLDTETKGKLIQLLDQRDLKKLEENLRKEL